MLAMFGDLNSVQLIGNITNDLAVRYTPNGTAVLNFGLATNRRYKQAGTDEWKDDTTFHNIVIFGNQAEMITQRAKKGTRIFASGRLQTRSWQDKEGKTNYKTEIITDKIILLDRYERGTMEHIEEQKNASEEVPVNELQNKEKASVKKKKSVADNIIDPDDLPF